MNRERAGGIAEGLGGEGVVRPVDGKKSLVPFPDKQVGRGERVGGDDLFFCFLFFVFCFFCLCFLTFFFFSFQIPFRSGSLPDDLERS